MSVLAGQPSLFPDEDYHDPEASGFFAILTATDGQAARPERQIDIDGEAIPFEAPGRRLRQECFPNTLIRPVLAGLDPTRTTYIGQAEHFARNRRAVTVARIGLAFVDLDTYRSASAHLSEADTVRFILQRHDEERLPPPSLIVSSGRGYYVKTLFEKPIPRKGLPRWNAVQQRLVSALDDLGADPQARDVSRVLRVVNSTNEKTGEKVKIVWSNDVNGAPVRYGFDTIAEETLDLLRKSHHTRKDEEDGGPIVRTPKQRRAILSTSFSAQSLWWARLEDIRTLAALRGWRAGVPVGQRDLFLFLAATALGWCVNPNSLFREIAALGREFAPTLGRAQWYAYTSTTFARVKASWEPNADEQRYRYTTARLIELLRIDQAEMRKLSTLIDATEDRRRKRARDEKARRAAGMIDRASYLARAADRAVEARRMAEAGMPVATIAARLGVNLSHAYRLLA